MINYDVPPINNDVTLMQVKVITTPYPSFDN